MKTKVCPNCKKVLSVSAFYKMPKRPDGYSGYCKECSNKQSREWKIEVKKEAVDYLGGKCSICGYSKCQEALEFHHKDPNGKDFSISRKLRTFEKMKEELDKCILVCANCHRELHFL